MTTAEGTGELELAGGSRLALGPHTRLRVRGRQRDVRQALELDAGRVEVRAAKAEGLNAVRVTTPVGEATALGTHFTVELKELGEEEAMLRDRIRAHARLVMVVTVIEGAVLVSNTGGNTRLHPGGVALAADAKAAPVAAAEGKLDSAFPADALAAAVLESPGRLEERFRKTALGRTLFREDVQEALAGLIGKGEAGRRKVAEAIRGTGFLDPDALQKAVKGRFGLALLGVRKVEGKPEPQADFLFAAEAPDREAYEQLLQNFVLVIQAKAPQAEFVARPVRGVDVRTLQAPGAPNIHHKLTYAYCRGLFLVALDEDGSAMEGAIGRVLDSAPGLDGAAGVRRIRERLGRTPDLLATVNVAGLLERFRDQIKPRDLLRMRLGGLTSLSRVTYGMGMDGLAFREFFVAETAKREGLARLLDVVKPLPAGAFDRVPADALAAFGLSCDAGRLFEALSTGADAVDPEAGRKALELPKWTDPVPQLGGKALKDLAALFTGEATAYVTMTQVIPDAAVIAPLADAAAARELVTLLAARDADLELVPYGGGVLVIAKGKGPLAPTFGVANGCFVLGTNVQAAKRAAKFAPGAPMPLTDKPEFRAVMDKLPTGAACAGWLDAKRAVELGYGTLMQFAKPGLKEKIGVDAARLPLAEEIAENLVPAGSVLLVEPDAVAAESSSPVPGTLVNVLGLGAIHRVEAQKKHRAEAAETRIAPPPVEEDGDLF